MFAVAAAAVVAALIWAGVTRGTFLLPGMAPDAPSAGSAKDIVYRPISLQPDRYERKLLKEPWVRRIDIGGATFGATLPKQARFSIEGSGSMTARQVTADTTRSTSLLSSGPQQRTTQFLHGMQRTMEQRKAYVKGFSLSSDERGFTANWLVVFVEAGMFNSAQSPRQQRQLTQLVLQYAKTWMPDTLAWYQFNSHWIVLGPEQSKVLERHVRTPQKVTPRQGLRVAYILRHEIEHSVSAHDGAYETSFANYKRIQWMEEGTADVLARWPGESARMAEALGLPYPERAKSVAYDRIEPNASGYDRWVTAMRELLEVAGVRPERASDFRAADRLLQHGRIEQTPERVTAAIVREHRLQKRMAPRIAARIRALDGSPTRVRALARAVKRMPRAAA